MSDKEVIKELLDLIKSVRGTLQVIEYASTDKSAVNLSRESLHWIAKTLWKIGE